MDEIEKQRLFEALERVRWIWRDGALYAPNGTMWLDGDDPWSEDLRSFRDRMVGRVNRIRGNLDESSEHAEDAQRAVADAAGLLEVLDMILK